MISQPTHDKLHDLRLKAMDHAWIQQQQDPAVQQLSFDERLGLMVDAEWTARQNQRVTRNLKNAKLKQGQACIEDIDYPPRRELDRALIRALATGKWIEQHVPVIITGPTGTGKSYVACALANQACRPGYTALYRRVPRLLEELALAHADGSYVRTLDKLAHVDVLVLDDWGLCALKEQQRHDLLEILDDRFNSRATIITSQLPVELWHDHVGDPTLADAICDRLVHKSHRVTLKGPSRRKEETTRD